MLRVQKQAKKVRWTSQKHWEQPLTCWGCRNKQRMSGWLHRTKENSHLHTEGAETSREGQVDFTEAWNSHLPAEGAETSREGQVDFTKALRTATYILRVQKQAENVRLTSQKHEEQPLTSWGCRNKQRRSGGFHRSIEKSHLHPEGADTSREDQVDFTEAWRTATYILRVQKQAEKVRWNSQKHEEQPLTSWGCRNKQRRSGGIHRSMKNSHLQAEDAETSREGQVDFTEAWRTATYRLRVQKQAEKVRWISQKHGEQPHTHW